MNGPTIEEVAFAESVLAGLEDVGDTWDHQVEYIARRVATRRRIVQVEQLREAARVLSDRADVIDRGSQ